jgi:hypothetical protein
MRQRIEKTRGETQTEPINPTKEPSETKEL